MSDLSSRVVPKWADSVDPRTPVRAQLKCPFRASHNPHEEQSARRSNAWYLRIWGRDSFTEKVIAARMERLVSGFYPDADAEGLTLANRYLLWAFSVDDLADETHAGRSVLELSQLFSRFEDIFRGAEDGEAPLELGLRELVRDFRRRLTTAEYEEFVNANLAYFGAMLWEANNRQCRWIPDEATYQLLRPAAGAVPPFWALIAPLTGASRRGERPLEEALDEMARLAGRLVCWHNDVLSYAKERAAGDVHNLCIVFERHRQLSAEAALDAAIEMANSEIQRFAEVGFDVRRRARSPEVDRYCRTLESMVATTLEWTSRSVRYESSELADADVSLSA